MIKLLELIKKNFKLLVRAKVSSLVIFIGPLLLVSLLGLAYSQSSTFSLTASVYSPQYSELSESLITKMENQNFRILRQDSIETCTGSLKQGESQACIVFPAGMTVESGKTNEITFYVDYSQINLVWMMLDVMSARVSEKSEQLSQQMTSDLLSRMWFVEDKLKQGQSALSSIKTKGDSINSASSNMQSGVRTLDISVDFGGIDIGNSKNLNQNISSLLAGIRAEASRLVNETDSAIGSIESSVNDIELVTNDSAIVSELDDIDDSTDKLEEDIENITSIIRSDVDDASAYVNSIRQSLDAINLKLSQTQSKIGNVKKQRDDILPQFDSINSNIGGIVTDINSLQATLNEALQKIDELKGQTAESITSPITTKIEPVTTQKTHFNAMFPTLLVLIIMITGILLAATLMVVEKKSKAFFRNNFTPTSYFTFNLSTYVTSLIVLFIQLVLFASVSAFFFKTEVLASIGPILLLIFLISTVFICIGMFLGFIFKTEETVNLAAITLIAVFLLFSSAVIPLESLPAYLKSIAMFSPFVIGEIALKQALIFQFSFAKVMHSIMLLACYAIGIFLVLVALQNALRSVSFMHLSKHTSSSSIKKDKKAGTRPSKELQDTPKETKEKTKDTTEAKDISCQPENKETGGWLSRISSKLPFKKTIKPKDSDK